MADPSCKAPPPLFLEGLQIPALLLPETVLSGIKYKPHNDDVFVATYPKCGTTWTQHILALVFKQGQPLSPADFFTVGSYLEMAGSKGLEMMIRPGAIKVHLPHRLTPWSEKAKYINITRNPKDCCVSYFHHMRNLPLHNFNDSFDEFFERFITGNIEYGDYFDHLLGWYEHRNEPNVLFMTYEDIRKDLKTAVMKMASFIDDKLYAEPLRNDPEKLNNILKYSSFDYMKTTVNKTIDDVVTMSKEDMLNSDLPNELKRIFLSAKEFLKEGEVPKAVNFIRKGIVGDWKNYFSEEQNKRMNEKFAERTKGTDIPNLWKECM